jgi:hypothetical protein
MVIEHGRPLIKPARVPRVGKPEFLKIEMVTEFMAKRAQERAEGRNLFTHGRPHPDSDQHGFGRVVPEEFGGPAFAYSQWSGGKHADSASGDFVELSCGIQKLFAGTVDIPAGPGLDRRTDGFRDQGQTPVLGKIESLDPVTFQKSGAVGPAWWNIGEHPLIFLAERQGRVYPIHPWDRAKGIIPRPAIDTTNLDVLMCAIGKVVVESEDECTLCPAPPVQRAPHSMLERTHLST